MLLSAFISKRFRAYSGHKDEKNAFVSFIAKASTIGILLGVAVLIVALSVINGFEQQLVHRLLSVVPQVEYVAPSRPIANWPTKVEKLKQQPHVTGAAPFIAVNGMAQFKSQLKAVEIRGVEPSLEGDVSAINQFTQGKLVSQLTGDDVILGKQIVKQLNIALGDNVTLLIPQISEKGQSLLAPKRVTLTLAGIIEMGGPIDSSAAFIHLNKAQQTLGYDQSQVTGLRLRVDDVFSAHQVALRVGQTITDYVYISSWLRTQGSLYQDIQMVRTIVYIVVFLIIAVASFNIVSSLVMVVTDKKSDIAILRTLGASPATITKIFMVQGTVIGVIGTCAGAILGIIAATSISSFIGWLNNTLGLNMFDAYFINYLPSYLRWQDVLVIVGLSLALSFVATIYPALRAAKIQPAEALRYE